MRVLTFIRGFYPAEKHGGPPVSVRNLCELTSQYVKYYIVTTDHDMGEKKKLDNIADGWNRVDSADVLYLSDRKETILSFIEIVKQVGPDLVYLNSLFDRYTLKMLIVAKRLRIPCVLATRGELSEKLYRNRKKVIKDIYIFVIRHLGLLKRVTFHATFNEEAEMIKRKLSSEEKKVFTISNVPSGVDFVLRRRNKEAGVIKAIYVSRIVENKNLYDVIMALKDVKGKVSLDIYGFRQDIVYWEKCNNQINYLPENISVNYRGELKHDDVVQTMSEYDTLIFPTYSENYGQVIAESIISCCPPIISDRTPWTDIGDSGAGIVVPLHDLKRLTEAIERVSDMDMKQYSQMLVSLEKYYKKKINLEEIRKKYYQMYCSACNMKGNSTL